MRPKNREIADSCTSKILLLRSRRGGNNSLKGSDTYSGSQAEGTEENHPESYAEHKRSSMHRRMLDFGSSYLTSSDLFQGRRCNSE